MGSGRDEALRSRRGVLKIGLPRSRRIPVSDSNAWSAFFRAAFSTRFLARRNRLLEAASGRLTLPAAIISRLRRSGSMSANFPGSSTIDSSRAAAASISSSWLIRALYPLQ